MVNRPQRPRRTSEPAHESDIEQAAIQAMRDEHGLW
jgi:hypothetical protein